jgi:peptidase C25-like protein
MAENPAPGWLPMNKIVTRMFLRIFPLLVFLAGVPGAPAADPPGGLVIVAPERFHQALAPYLRHKAKQMATFLLSLEDILKRSPGADDPERLKRYLFDDWQVRGTRYVLLVGDADALPVRYMVLDRVTAPARDYAFYPSDLYYADLAKPDGSFEDWNSEKDGFHAGYFGEVRGEKNKDGPINFDRIDYLPDVAVGRWPVSTPEEVEVVAAKTIRYEEGVLSAGKTGARRAAFVNPAGWVDCRPFFDGISSHLPSGWSAEKLYDSGRKGGPSMPPTSAEEVVRAMNGGLGLLVHAGHGADTRWEGSLGLKNFPQLKNQDFLPVVISAGCSTARFATLPPYEPYVDVAGHEHAGTDHGEVFEAPPPPPAPYQVGKFNPTGLGEALLRRGPGGAVAYIGCNTGSQPCGLSLVEGFVGGLEGPSEPRLGDLWTRAIAHYFKKERLAELKPTDSWYPPSIFFQGMKFMVFGDPSLLLPAPKPGRQF